MRESCSGLAEPLFCAKASSPVRSEKALGCHFLKIVLLRNHSATPHPNEFTYREIKRKNNAIHTTTKTVQSEQSWRVCRPTSRCRAELLSLCIACHATLVELRAVFVAALHVLILTTHSSLLCVLLDLARRRRGWETATYGKFNSASHILPSLSIQQLLFVFKRLANCGVSKAKHKFFVVCACLDYSTLLFNEFLI